MHFHQTYEISKTFIMCLKTSLSDPCIQKKTLTKC